MVAVLARCSEDLLQEVVSRAGIVTKQIEQNVIPACGFTDLEQLATAGETGDFVCGNRLVQTAKALRNRIFGGLV